MDEDIRKQGILYLQQQRFGKVPTLTHNANTANNANSLVIGKSLLGLILIVNHFYCLASVCIFEYICKFVLCL